MTWFMQNASAAPRPDAPAVTGPVPSWGEQFEAGAIDVWKRRDSWNSTHKYRDELTAEMLRALDPDGSRHLEQMQNPQFQNWNTRGHYLSEAIGGLRQTDRTGRFKDLPGTPEEFDAEVLRRRKRDFDENRALLERGDSGWAKTLGSMAGSMATPENILTMGIGGPAGAGVKAAARYIGVQAALGAATELPGVIKEQSVAKDLGFKPEDPLTAVGTAAAGGAVLAGAIHGAGRLIAYARGARAATNAARPEGVRGVDHEDAVLDAAHALRSGQEPPPGPVPVDSVGVSSALLRRFEGWQPTGKWDRTAFRAGYGSDSYMTADGVRHRVQEGQPVSREDAERDLRHRITTEFMPAARRAVGEDVFDQLDTQQQAVLTSLSYNYGAGAWEKGGLRAVRDAVRSGQRSRVVEAIRDLRAHNGGINAKRRQAEADLYAGMGDSGILAGDGAMPAAANEPWPAATAQPMPMRAPNWFDQVSTPAGTSVDVEYRVVDLSDLRAASGDLQPRDRSRASSDEQIAEIAANLDPRRLLRSAEADRGAPIVGEDMMVESGNGRIAALRRAATEHPDRYDAYVQTLRDEGYAIPEDVRQPALVAVRRTPLDADGRRAFVRENNTSAIARMSATEQAATNADYLTQHAWDAYRPGARLGGPENTEFLRRVFAAMPQAERGPFVSRDGRLTTDGLRMVRQATFHRAFPADDLLRLLAETENPALSGMLRMMEDIAPDWAAFRAAVDAGYVRAEFDITEPLLDMVRQIARARTDGRDGQSVIAVLRDALATADMFTARDPDLTEALIGAFYKGERARPPEATQAILQRYIAEAQAVGRADSADLFGAGVTPAEALIRAAEQQDARKPMPAAAGPAEPAEGPAGPLADMRGVPGDIAPDGASSPVLIRSTEAELREMRDAPEIEANDAAQRIVDRRTGRADELPEGSSPSAPLQRQDNAAAPPDQANEAGDALLTDEQPAAIDAALADARAAFADTPDLQIRLGEGPDAPVMTVAEALRAVDENRSLIERMTSCSLKGTPR